MRAHSHSKTAQQMNVWSSCNDNFDNYALTQILNKIDCAYSLILYGTNINAEAEHL
jgi:hypothetical protein